jgi:hypothetical protein
MTQSGHSQPYSITSSARPISVFGTVMDDQLDFSGLLYREIGRLVI